MIGLLALQLEALKVEKSLVPTNFFAAFFIFNGQRYKVLKAEIGNGIGKNGEVISDDLEIACGGEKSIKVVEIQREGKKVQKIGEFMLGSQIRKGSIISNV